MHLLNDIDTIYGLPGIPITDYPPRTSRRHARARSGTSRTRSYAASIAGS
jgi:hypothetical protein